ncbi:MAG: hypothetical protein GX907_03310 [Clostridiaceae bacterium]|nr:hypothetical protein [Clostridiaceae bacterium]
MELPDAHRNLQVLHMGTEEPRAYYIPLNKSDWRIVSANCAENAWPKQLDLNQAATHLLPGRREASSTFISLDGNWDFQYFTAPDLIPEAAVAKEFKPVPQMGWQQISVPSCWQTEGFDSHAYMNIPQPMPWDPPHVPSKNPCALYLRDIDLSSADMKELLYLNFEGVDSCLYLWCNGQFVGYSQISHSTSEFCLNDFLVEGRNRLAVLVLKYSDNTYVEVQDKLRMSGIFRSVYLLKRSRRHIRDFTQTTQLRLKSGAYDGKALSAAIRISVELNDVSSDAERQITPQLVAALYDPQGNFVAEFEAIGENEFRLNITDPLL